MYKVSRGMEEGMRYASVIPVDNILRTVLLFPKFGPTVPRHWTSTSVLEDCDTFYVDPFLDDHTYHGLFQT